MTNEWLKWSVLSGMAVVEKINNLGVKPDHKAL